MYIKYKITVGCLHVLKYYFAFKLYFDSICCIRNLSILLLLLDVFLCICSGDQTNVIRIVRQVTLPTEPSCQPLNCFLFQEVTIVLHLVAWASPITTTILHHQGMAVVSLSV